MNIVDFASNIYVLYNIYSVYYRDNVIITAEGAVRNMELEEAGSAEGMVVEEEVSEGEGETENATPTVQPPTAVPPPPLQDHPAPVHQPDESLNEHR